MSRALVWGVFAAGLGVVLWVGAGYAATSPLALVVLALIIAAYLAGAWELQRFDQDSTVLAQALQSPPKTLQEFSAWLEGLPSCLRQTVARRIDGERVGLPGPTMAPYLVGLLVLLGMLGTFLGMVVTLKGAVVALDRTTDLPALREALSAPVKGLGLAFGTSVAGVAASAALGLLVALARRHRAQVSQALDVATSGPLREFSAALQWAQQRELQQQVQLQEEQAQRLAQQQEQQAQQLKQQQAQSEERQERQAQQQAFQQAQAELMQAQAQLPPQMLAQWQAAMTQMQRQAEALEARLLAGQERFHAQAQSVHAELAAAVQRSLQEHLRDSLAETARVSREGLQPMVEATLQGLAQQAGQLQMRTHEAVQQHLDGVRRRLEATMASEDGQRVQLAVSLGTLLQTLDRTAVEQRSAVDALLASSATVLQQVGERFIDQVDAAAAALAEAGGQLQGGAIEVASLGEAFGVAVRQFVDTSRGLGESLQRIDDALRKSTARSDDQLAYYVAQARELIELSVASQKQVIDGLQGVVRATTSGPAGADAAAGQAAAAPLHQGATSVAEVV